MIFDRVFGAYAVPGHPRTYWSGDSFCRSIDGVWLGAAALAGPWELIPSTSVPVSLRGAFPVPKERVRVTLPSGLVLVYEPGLRVFAVAGRPEVYVFEGRFLRYLNGVWLASRQQDGPWELSQTKGLPQLLLRKARPPDDGARVSVPSGVVMEYDADLALFRVADKDDMFFHNGLFFERRDLKWLDSTRADSGFVEIAPAKVPAALRAYYHRKEAGVPPRKGEKKQGAGRGEAGQAKAAPGAGKKAGVKPKAPKADKPEKLSRPAASEPDAAESER